MPAPDAPVALTGISVSVGRQPILHDVSLTVSAGQWHALLGPNGSGKTTVMRAALGLLRTSAGTARLFGAAPPPRPGRVGVCFGPRLLHPSRRARTELALRVRATGGGREELDAAWAETGLVDPRVSCGALSLGQAQRLSIVCALVGQPALLVLDEPTVGLDATATQWLQRRLEAVRAAGGCVWVSSHDLTQVERSATAVSVLCGGRLVPHDCAGELLGGSAAVRIVSSEFQLLVRVLDRAGFDWQVAAGGQVEVVGQDAAELGRLFARHAVPLVSMASGRDTLEDRLAALLAVPVLTGATR